MSQVVRGSAAASLDNGSSSPRIGAVTLHRHSSDSLGALVRHLSQRLLPGGRAEDAGAAAPPPQLHDAPPARCTPAAEASDGGSDLAGILPHVSPGHLLAPAQTSLWAGSPPPVQLQLMAASGESPPQQDALLDLDLLDDLLPAAQPVAGPAQQLSPQPQDETAALLLQQQLSDLSSPTSGAYSPAAAAGRNLGGPADSSGAAPASSSGTSWQQQREAGQARSLAHPIYELQPGEAAQPAQHQPIAGLQALLAAQRRPGQEASPGSLLARPGAPAAAAGHAAGAAAWEPAGAQQLGGLRPAWSLEGGHVELDLDLLEALPQAEPAAGSGTPTSTLSLALAAIPDAAEAGGWDHGSAHPLLDSPQLSLGHQQHDEQQQEEEQQCLVLYGPSMANQYTPMVLRFEELDTRRIRCGSSAACWLGCCYKWFGTPALFQLSVVCIWTCHAAEFCGCKLGKFWGFVHLYCPQASCEEEPQAAGGQGRGTAAQAVAVPPPHPRLLLRQHCGPAAAPPVGWNECRKANSLVMYDSRYHLTSCTSLTCVNRQATR